MDNPDTDNTVYTTHRTKVRENRRAIKHGQTQRTKHLTKMSNMDPAKTGVNQCVLEG